MAIQRRLGLRGRKREQGQLPEQLTRRGTRDLHNATERTEARGVIWKQDALRKWRRCTLMRLRRRGRKNLPQANLLPYAMAFTDA